MVWLPAAGNEGAICMCEVKSYIHIIAENRRGSILEFALVSSAVQHAGGSKLHFQLVPDRRVIQTPAPTTTVKNMTKTHHMLEIHRAGGLCEL